MTERKPPGVGFETWVERQIRQAAERGEFDDLPGSGEPIPGLDRAADEHWWVKQKLRSEGLSYVPPALAVRKRAQDAREAALAAASEQEARRLIERANAEIRAALRNPPVTGPALDLAPIDVERVLAQRRAGLDPPSGR